MTTIKKMNKEILLNEIFNRREDVELMAEINRLTYVYMKGKPKYEVKPKVELEDQNLNDI